MKKFASGLVLTLSVSGVILCVVLWLALSYRGDRFESRSPLVASTSALDCGTLWVQPAFRLQVPISNPTVDDVEVTRFTSFCRCVSVEPASIVIPAQETREVAVHVVPGFPQQPSPEYTPFAVNIVPNVNTSNGSAVLDEWIVEGSIRTAWDVFPRVIDLGELPGGETNRFPITARIECNQPVIDLKADNDSSCVEVEVASVDSDSRRYIVHVTPRSEMPAGDLSEVVWFTGRLTNGESCHGIPLKIEGKMLGPVTATPDTLLCGAQRVESTVSDIVLFQSLDGKDFVLLDITPESSDITVEEIPADEERDGEKCFRVSQRIAKVGNNCGTIRFLFQAGDVKDPTEIVVKVVYFGIAEENDATAGD